MKRFLVLLLIFIFACTNADKTTGVIEGGNPKLAMNGFIYKQDGNPASGVQVKINPASYLSARLFNSPTVALDSLQASYMMQSDSLGYFELAELNQGDYIAEFNDGFGNVSAQTFSYLDSTIVLTDSLEKAIRVQGKLTQVSSNSFVAVYGLDRSAEIDPVTGVYTLEDMPRGSFSLHFKSEDPESNWKTFDIENLRIESDDGELELEDFDPEQEEIEDEKESSLEEEDSLDEAEEAL